MKYQIRSGRQDKTMRAVEEVRRLTRIGWSAKEAMIRAASVFCVHRDKIAGAMKDRHVAAVGEFRRLVRCGKTPNRSLTEAAEAFCMTNEKLLEEINGTAKKETVAL